MYYLRGNNINITYDDFNYTELNYTNYTNSSMNYDKNEIKGWIDWLIFWWLY